MSTESLIAKLQTATKTYFVGHNDEPHDAVPMKVALQIIRQYFASPEVVERVTDAIKREAFALEGFPVKALFAENLLGKAALAAAAGEL